MSNHVEVNQRHLSSPGLWVLEATVSDTRYQNAPKPNRLTCFAFQLSLLCDPQLFKAFRSQSLQCMNCYSVFVAMKPSRASVDKAFQCTSRDLVAGVSHTDTDDLLYLTCLEIIHNPMLFSKPYHHFFPPIDVQQKIIHGKC